jgi:hypothetical protein
VNSILISIFKSTLANRGIRIAANCFYCTCLFIITICLILGIWSVANFNQKEGAALTQYGAAIHKYPLVNRFIIVRTDDSSLLGKAIEDSALRYRKIYAIDGCKTSEFDSISALFDCANVGEAERLNLVIDDWGQRNTFAAIKGEKTTLFKPRVGYLLIDSALLLLSLALSLLLFAKVRRFISGYLISLALLINVCESQFFYIGTNIFYAVDVESIRLSLAFIVGPLGLYFFPKTFDNKQWQRLQLSLVVFCIVLLLVTYHFVFPYYTHGWRYFLYAVSFVLLVLVVQFILKYRLVLNTKERKQVVTMLFCVTLGLALYLPLIITGNYGFLIGRYIIVLGVGFGVFFALMRYGLWQVDSLISKSATLSLLSVIAFSFWAGLDQGMQALLNQTLGLSNKTFTAFLAAAISSLFAIPAYNYISKSCDAFFNKDLYLLKRFLSKDVLVLAETQKLNFFVEELGKKLLNLSGAHNIALEFFDYNRLSQPILFNAAQDIQTNDYMINTEVFEYKIDHILSVHITLEFVDRRINREIKHEIEEGTDEIARALASCTRWNYLESLDPSKSSLRPLPI